MVSHLHDLGGLIFVILLVLSPCFTGYTLRKEDKFSRTKKMRDKKIKLGSTLNISLRDSPLL